MIEQCDGPTEVAAAAARAERKRKAIATKLEVDTKKAMEDAGRTFLKQQKEASPSSTIPEIVDDLESKLFTDTTEGLSIKSGWQSTEGYTHGSR